MSREPTRVILLRDSQWPDMPGVCCWRHAIRQSLADAGCTVAEIDVSSPVDRPPTVRSVGRLAWMPGPVRRPLALSYRTARATKERLARATATRYKRDDAIAAALRRGFDGASLAIAESVGVASVAVSAGIPASAIWALVLPADAVHGRGTDVVAHRIATLGTSLGGFLTDSEIARDSVERAVPQGRPHVEIFPPLALDVKCPICGSDPVTASADPALVDGVPVEVAQLAVWRDLIAMIRSRELGAIPYSFAALRLLGPDAAWLPAQQLSWDQQSATSAWAALAGGPTDDWSAARQAAAVAAMVSSARPGPLDPPHPRRRVVISGYDLKFARELATRLDKRSDFRIDLDDWPSLGRPSVASRSLVQSADAIFAEWARPSAVALARDKRPDQLLVVRLHRYELDHTYPRDLDIDRVDAVVHVSPPIRARILDELGWPAEKLVYIPNYLDVDWLDRPKLPDARFGIGFVGMEWANKRFDLALDILAAVREQDPRFTLFVRSALPWDNQFAWTRPAERLFVGAVMERIEQDSRLRGGVVFDQPGRDMARWYRRVGHVLSMSDIESFHLAAAEGMASGAIPVIRPWPGATQIYGPEWIHDSATAATAAILESADPGVWAERAARARAEIRRTTDPAQVIAAWADLLHGDIAGAQRRFG